MAAHNETWTDADELDYLSGADTTHGITRADARKGFAATWSAAPVSAKERPTAKKTHAAGQIVIGAITHVGRKGCKVVRKGRFILQAASAWQASDFGKTVVATSTPGKVEAADRTETINLSASSDFSSDVVVPSVAQGLNGQITIVGDATDAIEGIGAAYLCECF